MNDNSLIVEPKDKITVNSSHQPSQEFPIGMTPVRVIATDNAGNIALCYFLVEIKGISYVSAIKRASTNIIDRKCV